MSNRRVYSLLAAFLLIFWGAVLSGLFKWLAPNERVYDCSMAEFHPDYTPAVRKACREKRGVKL